MLVQFIERYLYIPKLIDFCEQNNNHYIIQEYIEGENLQSELNKQGGFSEKEIIIFLKQLLLILKFIHQKNIIHRDIKPQNIIRKIDDQQLYLVDFGAAKLLSNNDPFQTATVIGSAEYIAPEQARGKTVFASDIYSLGVTCIHLLTVRSPFDLIDMENNWIWEEYLFIKLNPKLIKIINKMINFSLNKRYTNIQEIESDLEQIENSKSPLMSIFVAGVGLLGGAGLLFLNKLTKENIPQVVDESPEIIINKPTEKDNNTKTSENIAEDKYIPSESVKALEEKAIKHLMFLTDIQDKYYQKSGSFFEATPPKLDSFDEYIFTIKRLSEHHLAIIALAKENNLRNFVTVIWGGKPNLPKNMAKATTFKPKDTDWGVLSSPNLMSGKTNENAIRFNYCETPKPERKYPNFAPLKLTDSLPLSYEELSCPEGYVYSLSFIEVMSKQAAEMSPAIIYDKDGNNLQINDPK